MRRLRQGRLGEERGAVAVTVGVALVALVAMLAVVVDLAALYAERRQLQNGADAAALAVALGCARLEACPDIGMAQAMADGNANDGSSAVSVTADQGVGTATATTSAVTGGAPGYPVFFAGVFGIDRADVGGVATASWGVFAEAEVTPLAVSFQEWNSAVGGADSLPAPSDGDILLFDPETNTTGSDPEGFGWLRPEGQCQATVAESSQASGQQEGDPPAGCTDSHLRSLVDDATPVIVPLFDDVSVQGPRTYGIVGFTGFVLDGYRFGSDSAFAYGSPPPCPELSPEGEPQSCIRGQFTRYAAYGTDLDFGEGFPFGAYQVLLTD